MILFLYTVTHPKNRILAIWNAVFLCSGEFSKIEPSNLQKLKQGYGKSLKEIAGLLLTGQRSGVWCWAKESC
jgi:hypothetical protein